MMHASAGLESLTGATSVGALRRSRTGHTAPFRIAEEKSAAQRRWSSIWKRPAYRHGARSAEKDTASAAW